MVLSKELYKRLVTVSISPLVSDFFCQFLALLLTTVGCWVHGGPLRANCLVGAKTTLKTPPFPVEGPVVNRTTGALGSGVAGIPKPVPAP